MIKIKGYSDSDLKYIKDNYENKTNNELSLYLGKSVNSIQYAASKMGLLKQPHKPWTKEEDEYLINNYIQLSSKQIADHLGRTVHSINARRDELGLIRHEAWTVDEINYIKENYFDLSHKEMGLHLNRSEAAVRAKCFDLNLYKKEIPWEDWELQFVKDNYMNMTRKEIAEYLNRSYDAVQIKASRMGLKKYPYYCNYHYFDKIDTEEKAYWLGFLTADGWISKNEKTGAGVVGIELQYGDIKHLKKFNKSLGGNYMITDRWRPCTLSSNPNKLNHMCVIRIFSIIMYDTLVELGFANNKSYDFTIPNIRHDLIRHYLRGYFDGDGCFCLSNKSFGVSFITASERLNDDIINICKLNNIDIHDYSYIDDYGVIIHRPTITKNSDKIQLLDYMYKDCSIYLDRKYKKYLKAKQKYDPQNGLAAQKYADKSKNAEEIGNAGMPTRVEG